MKRVPPASGSRGGNRAACHLRGSRASACQPHLSRSPSIHSIARTRRLAGEGGSIAFIAFQQVEALIFGTGGGGGTSWPARIDLQAA